MGDFTISTGIDDTLLFKPLSIIRYLLKPVSIIRYLLKPASIIRYFAEAGIDNTLLAEAGIDQYNTVDISIPSDDRYYRK